jgi:hypothetical protein
MRIEDLANPLISDPEQVGADNFQKLFSAIPQTAQQVETDKPQDLTRTISLNLKDIGQLDYQEQQDKKDKDKPDDAVSTYLQTIGLAGGIAKAPVKLQTVTPNIESFSTTSKPVQVAALRSTGAMSPITGVAAGVSDTDLLSTDQFEVELPKPEEPLIDPVTSGIASTTLDLASGPMAEEFITGGLKKIGISNKPITSVGSYNLPGYSVAPPPSSGFVGPMPKTPTSPYVATTASGQVLATGSAALGAISAAEALKGGIKGPEEAFQFGAGTLTTLAGLQTAGIMGGTQFAAIMANPYIAIPLAAASILVGAGVFNGKSKPPMGGVEFRLVDDAGKQYSNVQEGQKRRIKAVNPHSYNGFNSGALLAKANKNVDYLYAFADEFGLKINESAWANAAFGPNKYMPRGREAPYRSALERIDSMGDGSKNPTEWLRHALEYEGPNGERIVEGNIYKGLRIVNGQPVRAGYRSQEDFQKAVDKFNKQFFA